SYGQGLIGAPMKGPDKVDYFQCPAEGLKFERADVFLSMDSELMKFELKEQASAISGFASKAGSKLGKVGKFVGGGIAETIGKVNNILEGFMLDETGVWDKWYFAPEYIIADPDQKKAVRVEVFVLPRNENDNSSSMSMMQDKKEPPKYNEKTGGYMVPYKINCRFELTTPRGEVIMRRDLGELSGKAFSKRYYAEDDQAPSGLRTATTLGIKASMNEVRRIVYGPYGFGQFSAKIKLAKLKDIKAAKKLTDEVIEVFTGKRGLLLVDDEKAKIQNYVDIIEKNISLVKDKNRWLAFHNLSVCYAWLENIEKANENYENYRKEIKEIIDKFELRNKILAGEAESGSFVSIGMKAKAKYAAFNQIRDFVNYYPKGAKRYPELIIAMNRPLKKFVDFYAYNDLLAQLYQVNYPFQFFPLNDFNGDPKKIEGSLTKDGYKPIEFEIKCDRKRRIKEMQLEQLIPKDGKEDKLKTRQLQPIYNKDNGEYIMLSNPNERNIFNNDDSKKELRSIIAPLTKKTKGEAVNIMKNAGFMGDKSADEYVQLKFDLSGKMYIIGKNNYYRAPALFEEILVSNGIEVKREFTSSDFIVEMNINKQGALTYWKWDGNVFTDFSRGIDMNEKSITAEKLIREVKVVETDDKGYPKKIEYKFDMNGSFVFTKGATFKEWGNAIKQWEDVKPHVSGDKFEFLATDTWDCEYKYDSNDNWIEMKVGPYTAKRTFKY
ncbi:MAG: hypothetical protein K8R41_07575, partial [Bacteroidales bacterium]|nr:hypothetical protein [Bacteroidales bacterium]